MENTHLIFTKANSDTDGRIINKLIDEYANANPFKAKAFTSLGQLRYLSALQFMDAVVGNSSSGLAEAPSFKIATVNIGDRQKGRIKATSVIDCDPDKASITKSLKEVYTLEMKKILEQSENPYGDGLASLEIINIIKKTNIDNLLKKKFYDL